MSLNVSLIGTGAMGGPMAVHLAKAAGRLTLYDLKREAAEAAAQAANAEVAGSLAEAAEGADLVITMLANAEVVRAALFGAEAGGDSLAATLAKGAIVCDMSSSFPPRTQATGKQLATQGAVMLDGPVSGGVARAVSGELTIMLGGDDAAAIERATPMLESMGKVFRTGPLGSGHALKCLNNYLSASGLRAASEAVLVGRAFGLDPSVMIDVINTATGRNTSTERKFHDMILDGRFAAGFRLELMSKDLKTAADLSASLGLQPAGIEAETALWREAQDSLEPGVDHTAIFRFVEQTMAEKK